MNPMEMIKKYMGQNMSPEKIAMNMMGMSNNPYFDNLIKMARNGDTAGIEKFARNIMSEQGRDFEQEFSTFRNNFK